MNFFIFLFLVLILIILIIANFQKNDKRKRKRKRKKQNILIQHLLNLINFLLEQFIILIKKIILSSTQKKNKNNNNINNNNINNNININNNNNNINNNNNNININKESFQNQLSKIIQNDFTETQYYSQLYSIIFGTCQKYNQKKSYEFATSIRKLPVKKNYKEKQKIRRIESIFFLEAYNPWKQIHTIKKIDLHEQKAAMAMQILVFFIEKFAQYLSKYQIVVGQGNHSQDGVPILKKLVIDYLEENKISYVLLNPGLLEIQNKKIEKMEKVFN
ncbi:nedd4-binding protein [Anaeramoeba ignava]|uniref:Nedd4-binding protein n=1 Tax=Anaeramoeba ignava TaxID=1746090 RepID=A0A9Q0RHY1_ANAIG|nr:nedd4-binding protein [Anaeramoeba ignava]